MRGPGGLLAQSLFWPEYERRVVILHFWSPEISFFHSQKKKIYPFPLHKKQQKINGTWHWTHSAELSTHHYTLLLLSYVRITSIAYAPASASHNDGHANRSCPAPETQLTFSSPASQARLHPTQWITTLWPLYIYTLIASNSIARILWLQFTHHT